MHIRFTKKSPDFSLCNYHKALSLIIIIEHIYYSSTTEQFLTYNPVIAPFDFDYEVIREEQILKIQMMNEDVKLCNHKVKYYNIHRFTKNEI